MVRIDSLNVRPLNFDFLWRCSIFLAILFLCIGCGGTQIKKDRWIPLTSGTPVQGTQRSVDGVVTYEYTYQRSDSDGRGQLDISGTVTPAAKLESLDVYINFLDTEGKIIDLKSIYNSGTGRGTPKRTFTYTFDTPPGTQSIAFTISGRAQRDLF